MKPLADPRLDFVFKWLFATDRNRDLLIDLLNAVLDPPPERRVVSVEFGNPFSPKETSEEKLTVVDVRAQDQSGRIFLVEMQLELRPFLDKRFLFYWTETYHQQLSENRQSYEDLRPVVLIVFLNQPLFAADKPYHQRFQIVETAHGTVFCGDLEIHTIELAKLRMSVDRIAGPLERWTWFLRNARTIDSNAIPETLAVPPIVRAMEELVMITEAERDSFRRIAEKMAKLDANQEARDRERHAAELQKAREEARAEAREEARAEAREEARAEVRAAELAHRIRFSQSLLGMTESPDAELRERTVDELARMAESLELQVRNTLIHKAPGSN